MQLEGQRVHELAEELGFNRQELVNTINELGLGFTVNNFMSRLSKAEVKELKTTLEEVGMPAKSSPAKQDTQGDGPGIGPKMITRVQLGSEDESPVEPESREDDAPQTENDTRASAQETISRPAQESRYTRSDAKESILDRYPPTIAAAYQEIWLKRRPGARHKRLLDLIGAIFRYLLQVACGAAADVTNKDFPEQTLESYLKNTSRSLGDRSKLLCKLLENMSPDNPLYEFGISNAGSKDFKAIPAFRRAWFNLKRVWKDNDGGNGDISYSQAVDRQVDESPNDLQRLDAFFSRLTNCRNAYSHSEEFKIGDTTYRLDLQDNYYDFINPFIRRSLVECLEYFEEFFKSHVEHQVTEVQVTEDAKFYARLFRVRGSYSLPVNYLTDELQLLPSQTWLFRAEKPAIQLLNPSELYERRTSQNRE